MSEDLKPVDVTMPKGGFSRSAAEDTVQDSGLPEVLARLAPSPFGQTATSAAILECLVEAVDLGLAASAGLEGVILADLATPASFAMPKLEPEHRRLISAFQIVVTADDAARRITERCPVPDVEGALELDGVDSLIEETVAPSLAARMVRLCRGYLEAKASRHDPDAGSADVFAGTTIAASLHLLKNAVTQFARSSQLRPLVEALGTRRVRVAGFPYQGLTQQAPTDTPAGLLPLWPDDIVGNVDYLEAGKRLARDVAGFDLALGKNPKRVNPILFGLGVPGCGKTVTAHAVGNYFLKYCRERGLPARFLVVRRSDWASSYQNASASNLIRIFTEEVYGFDGVAGVYWPDIDTALASRSSSGLRMEEKQNLGAVFGIFDGTLVPKDGKWFMICDANTMHMDEAAISRIAQNPFTVAGPETVEHYVHLMKNHMLRDLHKIIPQDHAAWERIGKAAIENELSGRNIEAICGNIRTGIQDFEFPESYFAATTEERQKIITELSHPVDEAAVLKSIEDWVAFKKEAARRDEASQFQAEVDTVVRQLNAGRAAMEKATEMGLAEA